MREYVNVKCHDCGNSYTISYTYWNQCKNNPNKIWRCKSCNSKYKSEFNKNRWSNLSESDREKISVRQSETQSSYWKKLSKKDRVERLNNFINAGQLYWDNMSENDKEQYKKLCKDNYDNMSEKDKEEHRRKSHEWYENLSDKEKVEWAKRTSLRWKELPDDEKQRRSKLLIENNRKWLQTMSEEERKKHYGKNGDYLKRFWKNVTDDQKLLWFQSLSGSHANNPNEIKTKTENIFINYLNIYGFEYEYQYVNKIFPDDFYEMFDKDKSPYHAWDFILHLKNGDVLVDIDGSEHTLLEGDFITKDGIDVGKRIQENDSKRPYQTDGLPAYIILSYEDKIDKSVPVLILNENKIISFKEFITIISFMNMNDKEIKDLMKGE